MIKVLPQGICTEGLDGRPESKQTGKGEARTKSVLISATPIKCCRFEREKKKNHPACRGCKEDSRASLLMSHRFMQTKEMKKKKKKKQRKIVGTPSTTSREASRETRDIQLQLMNRNQKLD